MMGSLQAPSRADTSRNIGQRRLCDALVRPRSERVSLPGCRLGEIKLLPRRASHQVEEIAYMDRGEAEALIPEMLGMLYEGKRRPARIRRS